MKSVNCNIIRDLLPSYGTELLSKDSNDLIEEHLKTCSDCRKIMSNINGDKYLICSYLEVKFFLNIIFI